MTENTKSSAFAAVVGRLGELSESELRQLHSIIGIRLGFPGISDLSGRSTSVSRRGQPATRGGNAPRRGGKKGAGGRRSGNPQRKSQWANHPQYLEYRRLKSVVEKQAKDEKVSFNAVRTDEARQYREAFTQWVEAKSSFRGRDTSDKESSGEEDNSSDEETEAVSPIVRLPPAGPPAGSTSNGGKAPANPKESESSKLSPKAKPFVPGESRKGTSEGGKKSSSSGKKPAT